MIVGRRGLIGDRAPLGSAGEAAFGETLGAGGGSAYSGVRLGLQVGSLDEWVSIVAIDAPWETMRLVRGAKSREKDRSG